MADNNSTTHGRCRPVFSSLTLRTIVIALMIMIMLVPLLMVEGVIHERSRYQQQVLGEVAGSWGQRQTLIGPFMIIPYMEHITSVDTVTDSKGESKVITRDIYNEYTAVLLPETLNMRVDLQEEKRSRGLYDALVYTARLKAEGEFDHEFLLETEEGDRRVLWDKSFLSFGISDTRAIGTETELQWDGESIELQPGTQLPKLISNGFHIPLGNETSNATHHDFSMNLELKGSDGLFFAPLGKNTHVIMTSGWQHPSFQGNILPDTHDIGDSGFKADWTIPNLARNYPQHWLLEDKTADYDPSYFTAGVSLYQPVSLYSRVERAVKYGILFVALTFLIFFAFEITSGAGLHIIQYGLIGITLALFYLILLALAEHLAFTQSYIAAASTVVVMIWLYAWAVLRNVWKGLFILVVLGGLYYLLYLILNMEDYALLAGTALLVLATLMMMLVTRHTKN